MIIIASASLPHVSRTIIQWDQDTVHRPSYHQCLLPLMQSSHVRHESDKSVHYTPSYVSAPFLLVFIVLCKNIYDLNTFKDIYFLLSVLHSFLQFLYTLKTKEKKKKNAGTKKSKIKKKKHCNGLSQSTQRDVFKNCIRPTNEASVNPFALHSE